jgi:hypothetical protein
MLEYGFGLLVPLLSVVIQLAFTVERCAEEHAPCSAASAHHVMAVCLLLHTSFLLQGCAQVVQPAAEWLFGSLVLPTLKVTVTTAVSCCAAACRAARERAMVRPAAPKRRPVFTAAYLEEEDEYAVRQCCYSCCYRVFAGWNCDCSCSRVLILRPCGWFDFASVCCMVFV